jgi:hypothetical protein
MKVRGGGYGLDAELAAKAAAKYDPELGETGCMLEDQQTNAVQTHLCLRYAFNPNSLTSIKKTPSSPDCALPVDKQGPSSRI